MKLPLSAVACLLATAALAGCGGDDNKSSSSSSSTAPSESGIKTTASSKSGGNTVAIGMKDLQFVPKLTVVKVGQTVKWVNGESIPHNVTSKSGASFKSKTLEKGNEFTFKPTKAGKIAYVCTFHPGMVGTLNVTK